MARIGSMMKTWAVASTLGIVAVWVTGCGSVRHSAKFESTFVPRVDTRIEVGPVTNETDRTFAVDIPQMFTEALSEALNKERLLWTGGSGSGRFIIVSKVVEYDEGNAFKRWLLPGWGSTVLSLHCELREGANGKMVGFVDARRTVSIGGGYTIGAWKTIFASVATDVVKELRSKVEV